MSEEGMCDPESLAGASGASSCSAVEALGMSEDGKGEGSVIRENRDVELGSETGISASLSSVVADEGKRGFVVEKEGAGGGEVVLLDMKALTEAANGLGAAVEGATGAAVEGPVPVDVEKIGVASDGGLASSFWVGLAGFNQEKPEDAGFELGSAGLNKEEPESPVVPGVGLGSAGLNREEADGPVVAGFGVGSAGLNKENPDSPVVAGFESTGANGLGADEGG